MPGPFFSYRLLLTLALACTLAGCPNSDTETRGKPLPPTTASSDAENAGSRPLALPDFSGLVQTQGPTVVNVTTSRHIPGHTFEVPDDPLFEFFRRFIPDMPPPGSPGPQVRGLGSGFIISQDGLILTNAHVVAQASSVTVRLADGKQEFSARVLGADTRSDIALLKIDATGLPVAKLGTAAAVQPGQWVVAIGSPFGFTNTITAGVVSATNRELPNESIMPFIQTDVAVNPGNSGGPLINMAGEVIGVNSMIYSGTGGYMGVSFAIPIEVAMDVARQLQEQGKVTRGRLGVAIQPLTPDLAQTFGLESTNGVLISSVEANGPAARAGLKSGDVVLEYDGQPITGTAQLPRLVTRARPGTKASLVIWRDRARREITVTIGETPSEQAAEAPRPTGREPDNHLGIVLSEIPPQMRRQMNIEYGLLVQAIQGAAAESSIRPGDVILAVNQSRFSSLQEFNRILAAQPPGTPVALLLRRGDQTIYATVRMPAGKPE